MACLWLLAGCASPPTAVRPGDRVFSLGTYQEEIDRLAQPIRCYVDTTGPELKFYEGMKPKVPD